MVLLNFLEAFLDPLFSLVLAHTGLFYLLLLYPSFSARNNNSVNFKTKDHREIKGIDSQIKRHRDIANFELFNATGLSERLVLRARPNQRLVVTFRINNSFTTTDVECHNRFRKLCVKLIRLRRDSEPPDIESTKWSKTRAMANHLLNEHSESAQVPIAEIVRTVCFAVVSQVLLPFSIKRPVHVLSVTDRINDSWLKSKTVFDDDQGLVQISQDYTDLRDELEGMFDSLEFGGFDILDLVMPAYETLWRVVLLTYIHVGFRQISKDTRQAVDEVVCMVGRRQGVDFGGAVTRFSKEALRLYPPTKRIYRAAGEGAQQAADVEFLHHSKEIWGDDSMEFRPDRFRKLTKRQRDAYMPFGIGLHTCPAAGGFAARLIAVLVVALIEKVGTKQRGARVLLHSEPDENGVCLEDAGLGKDDSLPLPTGRDEQAGWMILYEQR